MNKNTFERIVEDSLEICKAVLTRKSDEYSSSEDKLHNFDKAKDLMRCKTKEFALLGMLNKHLVSVIDMIEKFEKTGELPTSGMIDEKIGDSINYFILLKACFYDDMSKAERKDPPIVEKIIEEAFNSSCFDNKRYTAEYLTEQIKQLERTRNVCFDKDKDIEMLKKEQAAMANSMYNNPRKRLVVENLRKILKPLFVWLTDNNRFVDYEKIKGILNTAELKRDHVPDEFVKDVVVATAEAVLAENKLTKKEVPYQVGTMIEIPRAALLADQVAKEAEFFSFGTNDLTQMTFGFSRDDASKFLPSYYKAKIYESDPFARLDTTGVGQLVEMAVKKGKATRPELHCGICGEHGGDPSSIEFCHKVGLDYVSCSPFRVPIARLAAAQANIKFPKKNFL